MEIGERSRTAALISTTLSSFLISFTSSSINVALPLIGAEFSINAVLLGWVVTSYLLAASVFLVPFGKIADIYGRKKIFTLGIIIFTVSSLLCALSTSSIILIILRIIQGIGAALMFATNVAILTSVYPHGERGRVLGINVTAVYLGLSLGPFLGGFLTDIMGWRSIFYAITPIGLLAFYLAAFKLKGEWSEEKKEKFDFLGSVVYGLALFFIMYGFSSLPGIKGFVCVVLGLLGVLILIIWELRCHCPVLNIQLFMENAVFAFSNLAAFINYSATFAISFLLSLYLENVRGYLPNTAGTILVVQPLIMALFSPYAGRLSDRMEPRIVSSLGMALTTLGLFLLIFLKGGTPLYFIMISLVILGLGFALFSSPNTNAVMSSVDKSFYGVASATLGTMRLVGQVFSMGIAMLIFSLHMGNKPIGFNNFIPFLTSVRTIFIIFTVLCFIGIFASLKRGNIHS